MMKEQKREVRSLVLRCTLLFLLLAGFFANTVLVQQNIKDIVKEQMHQGNLEFSAQLAYRVQRGQAYVNDLADTIGRMPAHLVTADMLGRKNAAAGMEEMFYIPREGDTELDTALDGQDLAVWARNAPIWDESTITTWEDESILLSAPVVRDGRTEAVVIGVESYQKIYGTIGSAGVWHDGVRVLVDGATGEMLILQRGQASRGVLEHIPRLLEELKAANYAQDLYHDGLLVCVLPVEGTSWYQIAAAHEDVLSSQILRYVVVYFLLTLVGVVALLLTIYKMRRQNSQREKLLLTDPLTGGWNRAGFLRSGSQALEAAENGAFRVVSLNVREFRNINHLWGEDSGNKTLQFIYHSFQSCLKPEELLCRSSMDRFLLLMKEKEEEALCRRIEGMIAKVNQVIQQTFGEYFLRFAVGVCPVEKDLALAISNANDAAKRGGRDNACVFFDQHIRQKIQEENRINELFDQAIREHHFQVYLQPKVDLHRGGLCRAEALVRWLDPEHGMIFPDKFIPLFEENGKICQLDLYMFEEVCKLISRWRQEGKPLSQVSVNISRFHIRNLGTDIWKRYKQIKDRYEIPDGIIEVELTETAMMDVNQIHFVKEILHRFRECGLPVALDDFGFAYSSLSLLKEFEVDTIKLDRSFFVGETQKSRCIVKNLILLAQNLDMEVVAEGIEEEEQVQALRAMNCDFVQGYVYSKPLPVAEFERWREEHTLSF